MKDPRKGMVMLAMGVMMMMGGLFGRGEGAESVIVIPPLNQGSQEILLICIPGMSVPASEYVPSCESTLKQTPFKTWGAVLSFRNNLVNPLAIERGLDMAVEAVTKAGAANLTNNDIFIWGHSAGGAFATQTVASRGYAGMILMGSYLSGISLQDFPVPVLTVGGELDGLTQTTKVAEDYRVCRNLLREGKVEEALTRKPVIELPGVNHAQMCNNFIQGLIKENDFEAEVSLGQALESIGKVGAAFIQIHRGEGSSGPSFQLIKTFVEDTEEMLGGFLDAQDDDKGEWCKRSQAIFANLKDPELLDITNIEEPTYESFVDSKPAIEVSSGRAFITTHSFQQFSPSFPDKRSFKEPVIGVLSEGKSAVEVGCKGKSQEVILDKLGNPAHGQDGTCREVHEVMVDFALKSLPSSMRERYERKGKKLLLLEDDLKTRGNDWTQSNLVFDTSSNPARVIASRLYSANIPISFGGATYCKGLAAAKVYAWIMHDSLPRGL